MGDNRRFRTKLDVGIYVIGAKNDASLAKIRAEGEAVIIAVFANKDKQNNEGTK